MKKSVKAALAVTLSAVVLCAALGWWQFSQTDFQERQVHHELAQEADPSIGDAEFLRILSWAMISPRICLW